MDTSRNHLVTESELSTYSELRRARYAPVPAELEGDARAELAGRSEVTVKRSSGSKVAQWAASERRQQRAEKRRRAQRASRRRNR